MGQFGYYNCNILSAVGIKHQQPNGTIKNYYFNVANTTQTIVTVPAGKTLYIDFIQFIAQESNAARASCILYVDNASDVTQFYIILSYPSATTFFHAMTSFFKPIIIPTGYKLKATSNRLTAQFAGCVQGEEV